MKTNLAFTETFLPKFIKPTFIVEYISSKLLLPSYKAFSVIGQLLFLLLSQVTELHHYHTGNFNVEGKIGDSEGKETANGGLQVTDFLLRCLLFFCFLKCKKECVFVFG